jgi:phosphoenolpyruvate synthase/pyruvate phosphate dikinase
MSDRSSASHGIATKAIKLIVSESEAVELKWSEVLVILETTLVMGVSYLARTEAVGKEERFSQEVIDSLTEAAHGRVIKYLRGQHL